MSDEKQKSRHARRLEEEYERQQAQKESHSRQITKDQKERESEQHKHYRDLDKLFWIGINEDHKQKRKAPEKQLDDRNEPSGLKRDFGEIAQIKGQKLGRGVQDFLTARQHGWDRAGSGIEHAGFGEGQSR